VRERGAREVQHAKSLTRQITQIGSVDATPTKDIHNIIDEGDSVTFTGRRNVASPRRGRWWRRIVWSQLEGAVDKIGAASVKESSN
jgi:hypothetical protein